jgi:hypothetical protein
VGTGAVAFGAHGLHSLNLLDGDRVAFRVERLVSPAPRRDRAARLNIPTVPGYGHVGDTKPGGQLPQRVPRLPVLGCLGAQRAHLGDPLRLQCPRIAAPA